MARGKSHWKDKNWNCNFTFLKLHGEKTTVPRVFGGFDCSWKLNLKSFLLMKVSVMYDIMFFTKCTDFETDCKDFCQSWLQYINGRGSAWWPSLSWNTNPSFSFFQWKFLSVIQRKLRIFCQSNKNWRRYHIYSEIELRAYWSFSPSYFHILRSQVKK